MEDFEATSPRCEDCLLRRGSGLAHKEHHYVDFMERYGSQIITYDHMTPAKLKSSWPISYAQWQNMLAKEQDYVRHWNYFQFHRTVMPLMRSHVISFVVSVCEQLRCTRETFHLAVDYFDRFMSATHDVHGLHILRIAAISLVLAMKIEDPSRDDDCFLPGLTIVDKDCTVEALLSLEGDMLKVLKFKLRPVTVNAWLTFYLQMGKMDENSCEHESSLVNVQFNKSLYFIISKLCDLCLMDASSLEFSYRVIAAAALYFYSSSNFVISVSNVRWSDLQPCINWMRPFHRAIENSETTAREPEDFPDVKYRDRFYVQNYNINMELYMEAISLKQKYANRDTLFMTVFDLPLCMLPLLTHPSQAVLSQDESERDMSP